MNKLLVVVDVQNDFVDGTLGTPEAQAIVPNVVKKIEESLFSSYITCTFKIPYDKGNLVNLINENAKVLNIKYDQEIIIEAFVSEYLYNYLEEYKIN